MSSPKVLPPVTAIPDIGGLLSDLSGREQTVYQSLNFPGTERASLGSKTDALRQRQRHSDNSGDDLMMLIENQAAMAKWHTEINFYSRMTHLGISAVDTVVKGQ